VAKKIGKLQVGIGLNSKELVSGLNKTKTKMKRWSKNVGKDISNLTNATAKWGVALTTATAGFAAYKVVNQLKALTAGAFEAQDRFAKMSQSIGVTTQDLIAFDRVAQLAGADGAEKALSTFTRRLDEAREGTGEAAQAIQRLGIDMDSLQGKSSIDQLYSLSDAIKNVGDRSAQLRVAYQLLGREGGTELIRVLDAGRSEFEAIRKEIDLTGEALSDVEFAQIELANDAVLRLKGVFEGLGNIIAKNLSGPITVGADALRQYIIDSQIFDTTIVSSFNRLIKASKSVANVFQFLDVQFLAFSVSITMVQLKLAKLSETFNSITDTPRAAGEGVKNFASKLSNLASDLTSGGLSTLGLKGIWKRIGHVFSSTESAYAGDKLKSKLGRIGEGSGQAYADEMLLVLRDRVKDLNDAMAAPDLFKGIELGMGELGDIYAKGVAALKKFYAEADAIAVKRKADREAGAFTGADVDTNEGDGLLAGLPKGAGGGLQDINKSVESQIETLREYGNAWVGVKEAFADYQATLMDRATIVKDAVTNIFQTMEDSLTQFVTTGKLNFADFAKSIIEDMVKIAIKQKIIAPLLGSISTTAFGKDFAPNPSILETAGRNIGSAAANSIAPNITTNIQMSGSGAPAQDGAEAGEAASAVIESKIMQMFGQQMRPGGMLYR